MLLAAQAAGHSRRLLVCIRVRRVRWQEASGSGPIDVDTVGETKVLVVKMAHAKGPHAELKVGEGQLLVGEQSEDLRRLGHWCGRFQLHEPYTAVTKVWIQASSPLQSAT